MSTSPITPFDTIFARLTQGMSAEGSPPVRHEIGTQADAAHTADDRIVWIPDGIETVIRPFTLPADVTPDDQAWDFKVSIYGSDLARVGALHSLLVGWLDLLVGPEQGAPPSEDAAPAELTGSVDLGAFLYPWTGLDGLALTFLSPYPVTVQMPAGSLASPVAVALAIRDALRAIGSPVLVTLDKGEDGARCLRLSLPADVLATDPPTIALDPTAPLSACDALGFDDAPAIGAAPSMPYRPGYKVAKSQPGPRGGTVDAGAWGLIVPVRLFLPIRSMSFVPAMIQRVSITVAAATSTGENIAVENPVPFP